MGPPGLPPNIQQLPPPLQAAFLALPGEVQGLVAGMPPPLAAEFLAAPLPVQMDVARRLMASGGGPGLVGPGGQPLPPAGVPPTMPPGALQPPSPMPTPPLAAPPPQPAMPPGVPLPQGPPPAASPPPHPRDMEPLLRPDEELVDEGKQDDKDVEELPERPDAPSFDLQPLPPNKWGTDGPSMAQVEADALLCERIYAERNNAIQEWHDTYYQVPYKKRGTGKRKNEWKGERTIMASTPTTMADRVVGLVAPTIDRLTYHVDPWDDSAATRDAMQALKNAARTWREELSRRHVRRVANDGMIQPMLERVEAGSSVVEGAMPFMIDMNPMDPRFPFVYEPLPVHEVYPLGHATLRIFRRTLAEVRSMYPAQIDAAFPLPDDAGERHKRATIPGEDTVVRLICWSDELWHGILCTTTAVARDRRGARARDEAACWVKPMRRHNNGFRVYQYGPPALGTPLAPTGNERDVHAMHATRGIYAAYLPLFRLQSEIISSCADGAFKAVNPAYAVTLANPDDDPPEIDDSVGGAGVVLKPNEKIEPLLNQMMGTADGKALLELVSVLLGEMMPPVISGRGQASSGADRFIAQQQAAALHIDPIINTLEATLGYALSLMAEGFYRKAKGKRRWLDGVPVRQRLRKAGEEVKGATVVMLTPGDIERVGTTITVKFKRYSVSERMQLGAMLKNMVDAKFMSRMSAMDELDVEDYERETARMLTEAIYEDPDFVKASIDALLEEQIDPPTDPNTRARRRMVRLNRAWRQKKLAQKGPGPAPLGQVVQPAPPEMPNMPGLPAAGVAQ